MKDFLKLILAFFAITFEMFRQVALCVLMDEEEHSLLQENKFLKESQIEDEGETN